MLTGTRRPAAATIAGARHRSRAPLLSPPLRRGGGFTFAVENGDALMSGRAERGPPGRVIWTAPPLEVRAGVLLSLAARSASAQTTQLTDGMGQDGGSRDAVVRVASAKVENDLVHVATFARGYHAFMRDQ